MTSTVLPVRRPSLAQRVAPYGALANMWAKTLLVYSWSAVIDIIKSLLGTVVFVYFWRALYANTAVIGGLALEATLSYILLARIFQPIGGLYVTGAFDYLLREGNIAHLLLRPLDVQLAYYVQGLADLGVALARQVPVVAVALLFFGLHWPTDPVVWGVFIVSALLGRSVLFCFDYMLACSAFYTTSAWGLGFAISGLILFTGGGLLPLVMMPDGLRQIAQNTPFAQAIFVPISLLSGLTPLSEAPRLLVIQLLWLVGLAPLSRFMYAVAIRRITVQGG
jgi:ABC-2 type transport system permease protein